MNKKQHITFFTPIMQRTGSEIVLLNLLNHLSSHYKASLISKYNGPLLSAVNKEISTSYLYSNQSDSLLSKIIFKIRSKFVTSFILQKQLHSTWYINTIVLPNILSFAANHNAKVILHLHELEHMFALLNKDQLQEAIHYPDLIIANSEHTKHLVQQYGRSKPVEVCYPAIDTHKIKADPSIKEEYRSKLNISKESFVWAMCGTLDENKNPFLFIDIAKTILKDKPQTRFMWIGGTKDIAFKKRCKQYAKEQGLKDEIIWITDSETDYLNYFKCADGFVLTSKKESFSIVTLEALLLGIPVVVNNCGGVIEILKDDVGSIIIEKNNIDHFSQTMIKYMDGQIQHHTQKGIERAQSFDISIWVKKWNEILKSYVKN